MTRFALAGVYVRDTAKTGRRLEEEVTRAPMTGRSLAAVGEEVGELDAQLIDFFADHYDRLVRLASLVCHSHSSIEDAVQAAMERAWRSREALRDRRRMSAWIDQIVVRESIRANRRPWWAILSRVTDEEAQQVAQPGATPDPEWIALAAAFRRLPAEQRAVVALHLYAGHPVNETAAMMGASVETTRSRLRLARQRLRRELGEEQ